MTAPPRIAECRYRNRIRGTALWDSYRHRVHLAGSGRVLEIGVPDATDLAGYRHASFVAGIGPEPHELSGDTPPVEIRSADPGLLPYPAAAFDLVVCTLALCGADPAPVLREIRRVLKPACHLEFLEHARPDGAARGHGDRDVLLPMLASGLVIRCARIGSTARAGVPVLHGIATAPDRLWNPGP